MSLDIISLFTEKCRTCPVLRDWMKTYILDSNLRALLEANTTHLNELAKQSPSEVAVHKAIS